MQDGEADVPAAPVFASRRERRAAERAAEVRAAEPLGAAPAPAPVLEASTPDVPMPDASTAEAPPARSVPAPRPRTSHPTEARRPRRPRRRLRSIGRAVVSVGVMAVAAAFAVAVSLPANVLGSAAPVAASDLSTDPGVVEAKQGLDVADTVIAAEAPRDRDGYASQSFADAERARYQASGQGFAPGFVPTAGAIRWPFDHSVPITSGFGYSDAYGGFHSGIDFIPGEGAPIGAIADGVVLWIGWDNTGYGYYAKIQFAVDGHQIIAIYGHMIDGSSPMYPGQLVKAGDLVGLTGDTGIAYGAHLHLGIEQDGTLIDPFQWLTEHATDATTVAQP
ncbi:MAG: hypothetical protein BGO95_05810 [Micrococcales bacterium 73-13]|nr:MAG: hypothetical protein BGO95_05810 [Micrococcales bacterium 73-13]